jgi:enterochelin esterase-like enzyme
LMGYEIRFVVYTPAGTPPGTTLPILYVTDGSEYLDARLGNMALVLDNLMGIKKIKRIKVVFVDARDPANITSNRRMQEMNLNEKYLSFFTDELVPVVEGNRWQANSQGRGILGTSLGGLNAAYFSFKRPEVFPLCGIQSPAFWYKKEIFDLAAANTTKLRVFMTAGTINDTSNEARQMKEAFDRQGSTCGYVEVSEGHSWGNWRNLLDDLLIALYGTP